MKDIKVYTLKNNNGTEVNISNYGGIIQKFIVNGIDIVTGKDNIEDYKNGSAYMGALIGRVGNRIGEGKFSLNGKDYQIAINNGPNTNHGGLEGFDKKIWDVEEVSPNSLTLSYVSEDGEENFPGELKTTATYILDDDNRLILNFKATSDADTPINLTGHSYFNLNGEGDIKNHKLKIHSDSITESDENLLPTGNIISVINTPLDFTEYKIIEEALNATDDINIKNANGLDHNYVVEDNGLIKELVNLEGDNLILTVYSDQPGVQVYTGNFLDEEGKEGAYYNSYDAVAIEPQNWPDAINNSNFPNSVLKPGQEYNKTIIYEVKAK